DGVLKHRETYEIMTPQLVGVNTTELPLGKLSGKHAFAEKLKALGYEIKLEDQITLFKQFKEIADKKKMYPIEIFMQLYMALNMNTMLFFNLITYN
ncbi:homocitrate synthase/isopropylmalate synthase family protein, partial [Mycobacterium tuberculosis]|uniref:homocitrate synthase/isopropylmalate synthase family protein n=1 Tax=Mycobacterium tuberculosis TaxID=1773 RepID=UPI003DA99135